MRKNKFFAVTLFLFLSCSVSFGSLVLYTPASGDCSYSWNSKYGPYGYGAIGASTMGIYLDLGGTYGNDYTVAIMEIPISALTGQSLLNATLIVESTGFDTNYYYGSAQLGWQDTGTRTLTGNVVADDLGSMKPLPIGYKIWDTYTVPDGAGLKSYDFTTQVQADIDAGRTYSTFVLHGSRETFGSLYTSESGQGPRLVVTIPEPATMVLLGLGGLLLRRRKHPTLGMNLG